MPDISEVFLQAAQVIGQNIKFQQQNEREQERIALEKQKLDELNIYREQALKAKEEELKARQQKWESDQAMAEDALRVKQQNAATFETNSKISQQRANTAQYAAETQRMMSTNKITNQKRADAIKDFEQSVFASPKTGNPELDKTGYISMNINELQHQFTKMEDLKIGGRLDALEEQMLAGQFPGYQTTYERATAAQRQIMGVLENRQQRLAQYRQAKGLDAETKTVLDQFNYLQEGTSPLAGAGAIDVQLKNQFNATQNPGDRAAAPGKSPGTVAVPTGQLTPQSQTILQQMDLWSPEILTNPEGRKTAASALATMLKDRQKAEDGAGITAILTKANSKSSDVLNLALDIIRSTQPTK